MIFKLFENYYDDFLHKYNDFKYLLGEVIALFDKNNYKNNNEENNLIEKKELFYKTEKDKYISRYKNNNDNSSLNYLR